MKNIGITGANGHVGGNLVRRLIQENYNVRVLKYRGHKAYDGLPVEIVEGDLSDPDSLFSFCKSLDVVIHLAAWITRLGLPFLHLYSKLAGQHPLYTRQAVTILQQGNRYISHEKATKELGFNPRPLEETLSDTVQWMRENKMIHR